MKPRRLGAFLALWSFGFACVHVAWALGWRGGVPSDALPIAARPVFLTYDLLAAVLMYAAAAVAVRLSSGGMPHRTRSLLLTLTLVGSCLALARGVPALLWDLSTLAVDGVGAWADAWFTVAGLIGLALWTVCRPTYVTPGRAPLARLIHGR